jgi:hypothetical protein
MEWFKKGKHQFVSTMHCYLSESQGETETNRICACCTQMIDFNKPDSVNLACEPKMNGVGWHIPYFPLFKCEPIIK